MAADLSRGAERFREALAAQGANLEILELPASTRTAAEAARAIGCTVAQIAKSIVFRAARTKAPLLVVASGINRVSEPRIAEYAGEPIEKADADFVREQTGFAIGGVPPLGHAQAIRTFIDEDLLVLGELWAAAGTPNAVFSVSAARLVALTRGQVCRVK